MAIDPVVVCSVMEATAAETLRAVSRAPGAAALVEIRADLLRPEELREAVLRSDRPLIVTIRPCTRGGRFAGDEEERRASLLDVLEMGGAFVDVEWESPLADLAEGPFAGRVILSHHGGGCRIEELTRIYESMRASRAARLKIVPEAGSVLEAIAVRQILRRAVGEGRALSCFASGRLGAVSRLLAPAWGSWATYGSLSKGRETASGQFNAADMIEVYAVLEIGRATRRFALIGSDVFGSPSPAMHRAGYRARGIDACYLPIELDSVDDLLPVLSGADGLGIDGLAVTMPFKQEVARHCRAGETLVELAGAVNTVRVESEGLIGYNTDGVAAVALIGERIEIADAVVALIGAGGTARAIAAALQRAGAEVTLFNRDARRAERVAGELGIRWRALDGLATLDWSVLVNATPLGGAGEVVPGSEAGCGRLVLDVVYAATPTPLIVSARRRNVVAIDGFQLLVAQAALQFERLTGCSVDPRRMAAAGMQWIERRRS